MSIFTKNPAKLPCPNCGALVDVGITLGAFTRMRRNLLICSQCGASVRLTCIQSQWSLVPLLVAAIFLGGISLPVWLQWVIGVLALVTYFALEARKIASALLVLQDQAGKNE